MPQIRAYSPQTSVALKLLGSQIRLARTRRRMTVEELAERVGVSAPTVRQIERGGPTVGAGVMFEAAVILGVPLFDEQPAAVGREARRVSTELALLPKRARKPAVNNDF